MKENSTPYFEKLGFRWASGAVGAVLLALGVGLIWLPSDYVWAKAAMCFLLCLFGVNALYCALSATEPWIAEIGPLP